MEYRIVKFDERILHIPDKELKDKLQLKRKAFKYRWSGKSEVSVFKQRSGLKVFLSRHSEDRIFIIIDFVHAFHQITRDMIAKVAPDILQPYFDDCFVLMGGKEVIPIGFPTSNYIFEVFISRSIDRDLMAWTEKHKGTVTRSTDNILVTWRKNNERAFQELIKIFDSFEVRITPPETKEME